jgi:predicted ATP-grasp superfamily ATP-dependent carboligase
MSGPAESAPSRSRVLVTDGEFKHTLGVVRDLAAAGHEVHLLARSRRAPAAHSRAVRAWYPSPAAGPELDARLLEIAARLVPVSVVPVGSSAMAAADRLRGRWPEGVRVAIAPPGAYATAMRKDSTAAAARTVQVEAPRERLVANGNEVRAALEAFGAPLVLKSSREEGVKALRYVRDPAGIDAAYAAVRATAAEGVLAQEYVRGAGYGFSALYWNGRRMRAFMHRRLREWPPSGGTSAAAESLPECPPLERAGTELLDALGWHGVAMVEFKGDPGGRLVLMEINAKFWGSHDLALDAGVRFPSDLVALLEGRTLAPQPPVRRVRYTWPLGGDLWHGLARPQSLPTVLWDSVSPWVHRSLSLADPLPHLFELAQWARSTPGALREAGELR